MEKITEQATQNYIEYVQSTIQEFQNIGNLLSDDQTEISPQRLNIALSQFYNISLSLNAEYQRQKMNHEALDTEYQVWYDEKFYRAKEKVISEYSEGARSIKPSVKEFESTLRRDNKEEWKAWNLAVKESEAKTRFLLRLMETLNKYDSILTTISYNMRSEMRALSIEDRSNKNPENVPNNKVRRRFPVAE